MEKDRAETNLGTSVDADFEIRTGEKPKEPKRRFIGRKAGEKARLERKESNGTIEASGAIQGIRVSSSSVLL